MKPLALLALLLSGANLLSSQTVRLYNVYTEPSGPTFFVDGVEYSRPVSFLWPTGSTHVLTVFESRPGAGLGSRYSFSEWSDSSGNPISSAATITIQAEPNTSIIKANFNTEYLVRLNFFACDQPDPLACGVPPGNVNVNGVYYDRNTDIWMPAGTLVTAQPQANSGFVFTGWGTGASAGPSDPYKVVLNSSVGISPQFDPAARITVLTSPPGLQILADHSASATPAALDWGEGTTHALGSVSPQTDAQGNVWAFHSWSNGKGEFQDYKVGPANVGQTLTATYTEGVRVSFQTTPAVLKLRIDGRENWPAYNFLWGVGSTHSVSAPAEQVDAKGQRYRFLRWNTGGEADQEVTVTSNGFDSGSWMVAEYESLGNLTVQSVPSGLAVRVNGADCTTPCSLDRPAEGAISVQALPSVSLEDGARLNFHRWSDGGSAEHTWTPNSEGEGITAYYRASYQILASSQPAGGVRFHMQPPSADGYYPDGTQVTIIAEALSGYRFKQWEGDLTSLSPYGVLDLTRPRTVRALLDQIPYVAPGGVVNAAGLTPEPGVAPGSIISIYGASLAPELESDSESPLSRTLADVAVYLGDRMLPLYFVSPGQINAQLPAETGEGEQTLTVHWEGHRDVDAPFLAVRNAPGLFANVIDEQPYAVAFHEDGTLISPDSPAHRGETVVLLGTGFGPYQQPVPDGVAVPESVNLPLVDPVGVRVGGLLMESAWAGAAPGFIGVAVVRFSLSEQLPVSSTVELKVAVNGHESNTILMPLE